MLGGEGAGEDAIDKAKGRRSEGSRRRNCAAVDSICLDPLDDRFSDGRPVTQMDHAGIPVI